MLLYHFTAREYLASIAEQGILRGEVPLTPYDCENAVWLTNDGNSDGHGLTDGRELTDFEKTFKGIPIKESARFPNKRAIRMTVAIPRGDRALVSWPSWGRKRLSPEWYERLNRAGGNKARLWFLYRGVIPPAWVREVRDLVSGEVMSSLPPFPPPSLDTICNDQILAQVASHHLTPEKKGHA